MLLTSKLNSLPLVARIPAYIIVGLLVLVLLYCIGRPVQLWLGTLYSGNRTPYLQMPSPYAMTVRWQTRDPERGIIHYGVESGNLTQTVQENQANEVHELRLTELQPGTKYYYSIGDSTSEHYSGPDYWFVTPQKPGMQKPVRFAVLGDPGYPSANQNKSRDALINWLQLNPREQLSSIDMILTTGDNAYRSGTNEQFEAGFFEPFEVFLRNVPIWPVYGNHDARRRTFFDIFSFPAAAESGGVPSGTEHYYSFNYNHVHFVILDTEDSNISKDSTMLEWLRQDLAANKQSWTIAAFHHPAYTKGSHDSDDRSDSGGRMFKIRENILPILEEGGVDLVLSGHSHMYERSHLADCHYTSSDQLKTEMLQLPEDINDVAVYHKDPKTKSHGGTIYTVLGSSSKLSGKVRNHPVMAVTKKMMGTMIVDIDNNKLDGYFISDHATVEDRFQINKQQSVETFKTQCTKSKTLSNTNP